MRGRKELRRADLSDCLLLRIQRHDCVCFLFFVQLNTVVNATASRAKRLKWFTDSLDEVLAQSPHINCATVDMFFFPILDANHCYVMCINTRTRRFDIIDNSSLLTTKKAKYKEIPDDLIDMFVTYLEKMKQPLRAAIVSNFKPTRMRMSWRDTTNKVDCAIYAMRHMETYMGEVSHTWDCGLEKGNRVQLRKLRQKYMHDILMSDLNSHRGLIIKHILA
nr:uncharacterized protein LOC109149952 [Ipomoea batatas]